MACGVTDSFILNDEASSEEIPFTFTTKVAVGNFQKCFLFNLHLGDQIFKWCRQNAKYCIIENQMASCLIHVHKSTVVASLLVTSSARVVEIGCIPWGQERTVEQHLPISFLVSLRDLQVLLSRLDTIEQHVNMIPDINLRLGAVERTLAAVNAAVLDVLQILNGTQQLSVCEKPKSGNQRGDEDSIFPAATNPQCATNEEIEHAPDPSLEQPGCRRPHQHAGPASAGRDAGALSGSPRPCGGGDEDEVGGECTAQGERRPSSTDFNLIQPAAEPVESACDQAAQTEAASPGDEPDGLADSDPIPPRTSSYLTRAAGRRQQRARACSLRGVARLGWLRPARGELGAALVAGGARWLFGIRASDPRMGIEGSRTVHPDSPFNIGGRAPPPHPARAEGVAAADASCAHGDSCGLTASRRFQVLLYHITIWRFHGGLLDSLLGRTSHRLPSGPEVPRRPHTPPPPAAAAAAATSLGSALRVAPSARARPPNRRRRGDAGPGSARLGRRAPPVRGDLRDVGVPQLSHKSPIMYDIKSHKIVGGE